MGILGEGNPLLPSDFDENESNEDTSTDDENSLNVAEKKYLIKV